MSQVFKSTRVQTAEGLRPAALVVDAGRIVELRGRDDLPAGSATKDFGDAVLLPGLVDSHVHINEPGRTEWEGFWTATRAAASGGVTTLVDMPLNCVPETTNVKALEAKWEAAQGKTWVDWATWGGVVTGNSEELPGLAAAGVPGFKCFMIDSGIETFAWVNDIELELAIRKLEGLNLPLLAHAEVAGPVAAAVKTINAVGADWHKYSTYLASRPDDAEVDAILMLMKLANDFKTQLHVVHLSSAQALPLLSLARGIGANITVETCVQYLWFAAEEIPDGATEFKCAPPIRARANREALWAALEEGLIDMVATDHSPCPPAMKRREEGRWDLAWGGIASLGLALPVMSTALAQRGFDVEESMKRVAAWMAAGPARLAGLTGRKGALTGGADADFVVFDPDVAWTVDERDLHFRHKLSPYLGAELRGRVMETWLRGEQVFCAGEFVGEPHGRELTFEPEQVRR
jgi:allantoinase